MKHKHKPLVAYRTISIAAATVLFVAFVLVLLVALSLPIIKAVYLLSIKSTTTLAVATSVATELRFGVWGVCATGALDQPGLFSNDGECFGPRLGYDVPSYLWELIGVSESLGSIVLKALLVVLVIHPITAGLSLVSLFFSLFLASHALSIIALIASILTAILGSIVFATDLALVITAKKNIKDVSEFDFSVNWGNGVWMVLVAVILTWIAVVLLSARACFCCGVRRRDIDGENEKHHKHHHDVPRHEETDSGTGSNTD